ncbi:MAG: hypothetical protein V7739_13045 [Motiliproteus sp.]
MALAHLLERISREEFETLSEDIKRSIAEHSKWMRKITFALVTRTPLNGISFTATDAHLYCKFGRWMSLIMQDEMFQHGSFLKSMICINNCIAPQNC